MYSKFIYVILIYIFKNKCENYIIYRKCIWELKIHIKITCILDIYISLKSTELEKILSLV